MQATPPHPRRVFMQQRRGDMPLLVSALQARDQQLGLGVSEVNVA